MAKTVLDIQVLIHDIIYIDNVYTEAWIWKQEKFSKMAIALYRYHYLYPAWYK
ncbi:hypothetical protein [Phosphitispora sp. TUW77]|uniref:hypothetical protein n=1 Tax=Phosphitispora sp. TUW77 TaxID=3152361 RepID=UPI003AB18DD0